MVNDELQQTHQIFGQGVARFWPIHCDGQDFPFACDEKGREGGFGCQVRHGRHSSFSPGPGHGSLDNQVL